MSGQPRPGDIVTWDVDPENQYGHVHILSRKDARRYWREARRTGRRRRIQQILRFIRRAR